MVGRSLIKFSYDSISRARKELTKVTDDPYGADWNLSPDGARVAIMFPEAHIRFFELATGATYEVAVNGWRGLHSVAWSPDSKTVIVAARSNDGASVLLEIDLRGSARQLLTAPRSVPVVWSIASPDGRYQAVMANVGQNNVRMVENY